MIRFIPVIFMFASGCAPYVAVQRDLIEQARRGVEQLERSLDQKRAIVAEYQALMRERLDDASDADIRARQTLTSDWVIEHRRAYAVALGALNDARLASQSANDTDQRNIAAIHAALDRLSWLVALPLRENRYE